MEPILPQRSRNRLARIKASLRFPQAPAAEPAAGGAGVKGGYRAAIIGLGFIGGGDQWSGDQIGGQQVAALENLTGHHALALDAHPRIELVTGSSRDVGRRQRFGERYRIPMERLYDDWRAMLAAEELDIVSVCTYTPQHEEMVVACAEAGVKVIWCEKPVAPTMGAAEAMLQACAEKGALLFFNHVRRWDPNMQRLAELIQSGGLGPVDGSFTGRVQWGSGRLGVAGSHYLDAVVMLLGKRVTGVSAMLDGDNPDPRSGALTNNRPAPAFDDPGGWAILRLEGGATVTVNAANATTVTRGFEFYGQDGWVVTDGSGEVEIEYSEVGYFQRHHNRNEDGDDDAEARRERWERVSGHAVGAPTMMERAAVDIVDCLDADLDPSVFGYSAEEGAHSLEIILAIHASHARHGSFVSLPLEAADRAHVLRSG